MSKKTIRDIDLKGKRVIVRVDFNVPQDKEGKITDDNRIVGALPTIRYLVDQNAKVVLMSHLGRPKGEFNMKYSLAPAALRLSELLGRPVKMAKDVIGEDADSTVASLKEGEVCLLENLRFHNEEEKNDPDFARKLSGFAKYHVPGIVVYHPVSLLAACHLKDIHQGHILDILAERSYKRRISKHRPYGFNLLEQFHNKLILCKLRETLLFKRSVYSLVHTLQVSHHTAHHTSGKSAADKQR